VWPHWYSVQRYEHEWDRKRGERLVAYRKVPGFSNIPYGAIVDATEYGMVQIQARTLANRYGPLWADARVTHSDDWLVLRHQLQAALEPGYPIGEINGRQGQMISQIGMSGAQEVFVLRAECLHDVLWHQVLRHRLDPDGATWVPCQWCWLHYSVKPPVSRSSRKYCSTACKSAAQRDRAKKNKEQHS